ncbi:hypothetical protein FDECE_11873 [Fusarium decemcellulare]|nr:hypothetical protein FDECE_11873 [Fusarium decemcellulare]
MHQAPCTDGIMAADKDIDNDAVVNIAPARRFVFNPAFVIPPHFLEPTGSSKRVSQLNGHRPSHHCADSESDQAGHMVRAAQIEIYTNTDGPTASSRNAPTACNPAGALSLVSGRLSSQLLQILSLGSSLGPLLAKSLNGALMMKWYMPLFATVCGFACSRCPSVDGGVMS